MIGRSTSPTPLLALTLTVILSACGGSDGGGGSTTGPQRIPTSVQVTPASGIITALGATLQLTGRVLDEQGSAISGSSLQWSTSDAAVAMVSGIGLVTGLRNGTVTITATSSALSASAMITVRQEPGMVTVTPGSESLFEGVALQLSASVADANANEMPEAAVSWATSDVAVATVDDAGLVTGVAAGSATITATSGSASGTASLTVLAIPDPLEPTADTNLEGEVVASTVTVPAGVTITATADLTITATDAVTIAGTITGDCVAIEVDGGASVTITGSVSNECSGAVGEEIPGLTILGDGELSFTDATVTSTGDITIGNDRAALVSTLADGHRASAKFWIAGTSALGVTAQTGEDCAFTRGSVESTTADGKDGADGVTAGTDGRDGGNIIITCMGNVTLDGTLFKAGDGGDGGKADNPAGSTVGGKGGPVAM